MNRVLLIVALKLMGACYLLKTNLAIDSFKQHAQAIEIRSLSDLKNRGEFAADFL